jgi:membrane-anchored protein YejM (alkaline phosphatase superfamily)
MPPPYPQTQSIEPSSSDRNTLLRWAGWFFLANGGIALLIALRYLTVVQFPTGEYAVLFGVLAFIGHFASLGFIGALLLFLPILLLPHRSLTFSLGIALASLFLLGITLDTFVFSQYRFHINGMVMNLLLGGAAEEIFTFSSFLWLLLLLVILTVFVVEWWLARRVWRFVLATPDRAYGYLIGVALFAVFLAENFLYAWADANAYTPITKQIRFLPAFKPLTADRWFIERGWADHNAKQTLTHLDTTSNLDYPKTPLRCETSAEPLNIIYIVLDSWRFDTLTEKTTPNIFRFARDSLVFDDHYSGANSTRTGIFTLFYGLPGTYWHAILAEQRGAAFIDRLIAQNYRLGIYASAKLYSPEFDRTVFAQVENLRIRSEGSSPRERDQNITDEFLAFLDRTEPQPFFGFLFYDSPHGYDFPPDYPLAFRPSWSSVNYVALNNDFDRTPFFNRYKNSIHFVDSLVAPVLDKLKTKGLLDNTVVLITSDHGQEFNDNKLNYWGHNSNFSPWQTRVPLVIRWPGKQARHIRHQTSHFDITPTLMHDVLGCNNDAQDYSSGKHLIDGKPSHYLLLSNYNQFAVMENQRITVVDEFGNVDILNNDYRSIPGARLPGDLMRSVMDEMSRFYSR